LVGRRATFTEHRRDSPCPFLTIRIHTIQGRAALTMKRRGVRCTHQGSNRGRGG